MEITCDVYTKTRGNHVDKHGQIG